MVSSWGWKANSSIDDGSVLCRKIYPKKTGWMWIMKFIRNWVFGCTVVNWGKRAINYSKIRKRLWQTTWCQPKVLMMVRCCGNALELAVAKRHVVSIYQPQKIGDASYLLLTVLDKDVPTASWHIHPMFTTPIPTGLMRSPHGLLRFHMEIDS